MAQLLPPGFRLDREAREGLSPTQLTNYRNQVLSYVANQQATAETIAQYQQQAAATAANYQNQLSGWQGQMQGQVGQNMADYAGFSQQALQAYIEQLVAQYGYQREDIGSQKAAIDPALKAAMQQLGVYKKQGLESTENAALERGILQSGIYAKGVGQVLTDVAQQEMSVNKQAVDQQEALDIQLARLGGQQASDTAVAQSDAAVALAQFNQQQRMAMLQAMMPQGPMPVPQPIIPSYIPPPQIPLPSMPTNASLFPAPAAVPPAATPPGTQPAPAPGPAPTPGPVAPLPPAGTPGRPSLPTITPTGAQPVPIIQPNYLDSYLALLAAGRLPAASNTYLQNGP